MRITILITGLILSLSGIKCIGQSDDNVPGTLLWKITKQGSTHTSWLFGTNHLFTDRYFYKYPLVIEHLNESEIFINEMVLKRKNNRKNIISHTPVPDSIQWHRLATKEQLRNIEQYFKEEGLIDPKYEKLHLNFYFSRLISRQSRSTIMRIENSNGSSYIDYHLEKKAEEGKKEIFSLDDNEDYFELNKELIGNNYSQTVSLMITKIAALDSMVNRLKAGGTILEPSQVKRLNCYYDATVDYKFIDAPDDPFYIRSLKNRNEKWMPQLVKQCGERNAFIAVGYGHLMYSYGIITQLRNAGFTVEPVPMK